jgi:uncharacterized membrane protein YeaQ/YmgE (transglycosylase-associated protein family)
MGFIGFLLIGLIVGWLAGVLVKGGGFGVLGDIIVGIIGAVIGRFVFAVVGFRAVGFLAYIIVGVVGAVIFIALLRVIKRA